MSELLDWDGPWSMELINLMSPVAVEISIKREQETHRAVLAAVGSLFDSQVGRGYASDLDGVLRTIKVEQLEARGFSRAEINDMILDSFAKALLKMPGMRRF